MVEQCGHYRFATCARMAPELAFLAHLGAAAPLRTHHELGFSPSLSSANRSPSSRLLLGLVRSGGPGLPFGPLGTVLLCVSLIRFICTATHQ